jgi:hypothetical protein
VFKPCRRPRVLFVRLVYLYYAMVIRVVYLYYAMVIRVVYVSILNLKKKLYMGGIETYGI